MSIRSQTEKTAITAHELSAITDWSQKFRDTQLERQFRAETFQSFRSHSLKTWAMIWASWFGVGILLALGAWHFGVNLNFQTHASYFGSAIVFIAWFAMERSQRYQIIYETVQLWVLVLSIMLTVLLVHSLPESIQRNAYPFYVLAIAITYITLDLNFKKALIAGLTATIVITVAGFASRTFPTVSGGPFLFLAILISANGLGIAVFRYTDQQRRLQFLTRRLLDVEKTRSEQLLNAVFPAKVAESLRHGLKVEPVRVDNVSVIFTDLSGFTGWSSGANPKEIVDAVEAMFGALDELAVTYGIDKIKTIGDAYMACSGLTGSSPQQFRNAIEFGREAIKVVERLKPIYFRDAPQIGLRVGIATGPVVAGVMGKIKPSFDVWGETVNLASRLESSGRIGHISVCNRTTEFIPDLYALGETVQLTLKGVGTYNAFQFSAVSSGGVKEGHQQPSFTQ